MLSLKAYGIDIAGLAETNTAWQHQHLQQDFRKVVHRHFRQSKVTFGGPLSTVDPCPYTETFQSGGTTTVTHGPLTSSVYGDEIKDSSGLGQWAGITLRGKGDYKLSIITAYRTCGGNINTSSLGSVYSREFLYFRESGIQRPNPRRLFFQHISDSIRQLQDLGHQILLMLDANSDLSNDYSFSEFISECDLHDLHHSQPPPSTYIGSSHRRIDYILGCTNLLRFQKRSGSLSYFDGPHSDHRGIFVDLEIPELCSLLRPQNMSPASHRALHTGNPELVSAYLEVVKQYYAAHKMETRMDSLYRHHQTMDRDTVLRILTSWDEDQGRAMAAAERKMSRPPKQHPWSPILRNSVMIRKYWIRRIRELTHQECYQDTFIRWQRDIQKYDPSFVFPRQDDVLPIETVRKELNHATKEFRKAQRNSTELCIQSYEDLIKTYMSDEDPSTKTTSQRKAKELLNTIQHETCRKKFGNLRSVLKPTTTSSLSSILVPRQLTQLPPTEPSQTVHEILRNTPPEELHWETVIDRTDIERQLLNYNREAFRAAAASPCGQGLIYNAISFIGLSTEATKVLQGMVPPEWYGDDQVLKEFLASFTIPHQIANVEPIDITISEEDVRRGFRGWRESTTTSPSGRHLGHYKALIQDSQCLTCLTQFLNIALFHRLALPCWCKATNILLEKDPGRPCINRLRIIHLFEADFNFCSSFSGDHDSSAVHFNMIFFITGNLAQFQGKRPWIR